MRTSRIHWMIAVVPIAALVIGLIFRSPSAVRSAGGDSPTTEALKSAEDSAVDGVDSSESVRELSMKEVLQMARAARRHLAHSLNDYTARFVKQEVGTNGVLGPETEMRIKVQTRLRGNSENAPMRVYLRFTAPESVNGREVLWGEDLYDGKMAVREAGLLLSLKTFWLDPKGIIAMQGQRYPISEIGLVRLVEQLIERGEKDQDNPDVRVSLTENHRFDELDTQLIRVHRSRPSGQSDDFSLAEIIIDPERQLVLSFRSFGWPAKAGEPAPLLESYRYHNVKTNVGLSDADFDVRNPSYNFPAL